MRFGKKGKLSPRYIGLFEILEQIGPVVYWLALPPSITGVHDVFHVSMLRKYVWDSSHVIQHQEIEVTPEVRYEVQPEKILDRQEKKLRNKTIPLVKVQWKNHVPEEATWELETEMKSKYPIMF